MEARLAMTITELRNLYREQMLIEAIIEPSSAEGTWIVEFRHQRGGFVPLTDASGEECHYTDLDSASKSAMAVGFKQVRIESRFD
ncbi:thymidylate kinase [Vibrio metschnikovii]|nr:thymidylate kinase [Vibrio metschnikovii]SUP51080.1 thymidylate kinase [Vibrio metschnikovii]